MKQAIIAVCVLTIFSLDPFKGYAKQMAREDTIREKRIEDILPEKLDLKLYNSKDESILSGSLKGKWVLLDFWETFCAACINSMPHHTALRDKYKDSLQIFLVTKSKSSQLDAFLGHNPIASKSNLPFIIEDTILNKLFPHRIIPHVVWINPEGKIKAITGGEEVTEDNLNRMMEGNTILTIKKDDVKWDYRKPIGGQNSDDQNTLRRSVLKQYDPSIGSAITFRTYKATATDGNYNHVYFSNIRPIQMFYNAFMIREGAVGNLNPNRIITKVKDSSIFLQYSNANLEMPFFPMKFPYMRWKDRAGYLQENSFSYDLIISKDLSSRSFSKILIDDLNQYFPIKAKVEKRDQLCLVIFVKDAEKASKSLKSTSEESTFTVDGEKIFFTGKPFSAFIAEMKHFNAIPIVDETGIEYPVDITVNFSESKYLNRKLGSVVNMETFDYDIFKQELNKYGLDCKKEKRKVEMLIVHD
ncbi:TlpA disulfide reductase family protein [Olivibacter sp. 47]|uniref:TlpA family protein disulfide reductase n=1 Tax=Olivibacter sp. 47 TaxID=3056486 RepID=UPI0025A4CA76|nr:TlpA disulfide reductase family protein [Olivibacter sp. 47]MDM8175978.1 TlpA disulfide reductase family protein [Olivibacter sp. 47]